MPGGIGSEAGRFATSGGFSWHGGCPNQIIIASPAMTPVKAVSDSFDSGFPVKESGFA